jgi:hypothetical protein
MKAWRKAHPQAYRLSWTLVGGAGGWALGWSVSQLGGVAELVFISVMFAGLMAFSVKALREGRRFRHALTMAQQGIATGDPGLIEAASLELALLSRSANREHRHWWQVRRQR